MTTPKLCACRYRANFLARLLGTTVVVAPPKDAADFWSSVPDSEEWENGYYTFPCETAPTVAFNFGGKDWTMSADTLNMGAVSEGSSRCVGSIVAQEVGMSEFSYL